MSIIYLDTQIAPNIAHQCATHQPTNPVQLHLTSTPMCPPVINNTNIAGKVKTRRSQDLQFLKRTKTRNPPPEALGNILSTDLKQPSGCIFHLPCKLPQQENRRKSTNLILKGDEKMKCNHWIISKERMVLCMNVDEKYSLCGRKRPRKIFCLWGQRPQRF